MKIVKRDGHIVDYDREKIKTAIKKANTEVRGKEKASNEEISEIIKYIEELDRKRILVEDIQDIIAGKFSDSDIEAYDKKWGEKGIKALKTVIKVLLIFIIQKQLDLIRQAPQVAQK